MKNISLAHGGGGEEMNELLTKLFKIFDNEILNASNDAAILGNLALSTDSFVLSPIFLDEEINIGKLCVCGSINDVLMVGAKPKYLSLGLILEEGFELEKLERILKSIKEECEKCGIMLVCGDTKVVPKGKGDEIYINTTVLGEIIAKKESKNIKAGLSILLSGDIGRHGASVLIKRNELEADIKSDCKALDKEVLELLEKGVKVVAMRDATRGGLSAVLNEWAKQSTNDLLIFEEKIIVQDEVLGLCELFGYEAYELANEGTFILCVEKEDELKALEILKKYNANASIIGEVLEEKKARVVLQNAYGAKRFLESPKGELLPRIC
ncbi:TPA: hydrogenase expression/formation protein HypE [Campylobacter jejuni]|nr:hydrogenase expression/formation protein HypE [Campylobacter jejuni subsp. jejuni 414]HDZ4932826.1 hydrogenase expression/formation protein HypE [Campylobacter jejuni]HDZ4940153.1 hydrogenase expression/formation protein HypE [Campylobacter jejuni]HDZ4943710.1 hydrogenase expression/formation protein HypE [Campylobacter jejuni]HDZ4953725.1 hydrogenase expression/formation protein HypE [Campylobacter jejuni]